MPGSLLAKPYPSADEWRRLVVEFSPQAIAHKLLLAHVPYVFRDEPLKFALFRKTIADAFGIDATSVFIVGSAMSGRSLKGKSIDKTYSAESDIDALIVSEHLFTSYVMKSLGWLEHVTRSDAKAGPPTSPTLPPETTKHIHWLAESAGKGIWRPDSLPKDAPARNDFFDRFSEVSLKTLGLQLSDDTVAKVTGRVARSFEDAVGDLANNIRRLRAEFSKESDQGKELSMASPEVVAFFEGASLLLSAAFKATERLSSASKGSTREGTVRQLFASILPRSLVMEHGDIVDSFGNRSGQLDGILIEARAPALRLSQLDPALVLAEGVVAVLEVKSDLGRQWQEVADKHQAVARLRPAVVHPATLDPSLQRKKSRNKKDPPSKLERMAVEQAFLPLFVLGFRGPKDPELLRRQVENLQAGSNLVYVMVLDPPTLIYRNGPGRNAMVAPCDSCADVLILPWFALVTMARNLNLRSYPATKYVGGNLGPKLQGDSPIDFITEIPLYFGERLPALVVPGSTT